MRIYSVMSLRTVLSLLRDLLSPKCEKTGSSECEACNRHSVYYSGKMFEARSDLRWGVSGFMPFDCGAAAHWSLQRRLDCGGMGAAGFNWIVNGSRVQDWPGWDRRQMGCRTQPCRMGWAFEWAKRRGIGQRGKSGMARGPLYGDDQIQRPLLSRCTLQLREVLEKGQYRSLSISLCASARA